MVDIARYYNVGIEIDYEESAAPLLTELGTFMQTYRGAITFDDSADPYPPSLLTIDFGQGAQVRFSTLSLLRSCKCTYSLYLFAEFFVNVISVHGTNRELASKECLQCRKVSTIL